MTLPERARALCDRFRVAENGVHGKAILAALEETRREAWEESRKAAQTVHDQEAARETYGPRDAASQTAVCLGALRVRDAIRALIDGTDSTKAATPADDGPDAA